MKNPENVTILINNDSYSHVRMAALVGRACSPGVAGGGLGERAPGVALLTLGGPGHLG